MLKHYMIASPNASALPLYSRSLFTHYLDSCYTVKRISCNAKPHSSVYSFPNTHFAIEAARGNLVRVKKQKRAELNLSMGIRIISLSSV